MSPLEKPVDREQLLAAAGPARRRVWEAVVEVLGRLQEVVSWSGLYDDDLPIEELLTWGHFIVEYHQRVGVTLRAAVEVAEPAPDELGELSDLVYWSSRQIESGLAQAVTLLRREMDEAFRSAGTAGIGTGATGQVSSRDRVSAAIADLVGRLRSELRKLAAFVVAADRWDVESCEAVLFPTLVGELERSQALRAMLVALLEHFHGSDERVPIRHVLAGFLHGQFLGPPTVFELEALLERLDRLLVPGQRESLYVDSYQRLRDGRAALGARAERLGTCLGDGAAERAAVRELAAILDSGLLAEILGEDVVAGRAIEAEDAERLLSRRAVKELGWDGEARDRLEAVVGAVRAGEALDPGDREHLARAVALTRGRQVVERLRTPGELPPELGELQTVRELLLANEDGLENYLLLLYGQVRHRNLGLVDERVEDIGFAERQVAVRELHAFFARMRRSPDWQGFARLPGDIDRGATTEATWAGTKRVVEVVRRELLPRLKRVVVFEEVEGDPRRIAVALYAGVEGLDGVADPSLQERTIRDAVADLEAAFEEIGRIRIAPLERVPESEEDLEAFLRSLG